MNVSERKLFDLLSRLGVRVVPQAGVGRFTVDFLLPDQGVVVEADGKLYHSGPEASRHAESRDAELQEMGLMTVHVWTDTIRDAPWQVLRRILIRLYRERGITVDADWARPLYRGLNGDRRI